MHRLDSVKTAKNLVFRRIIQPLFLLFNQLGKFVAIDPVLLSDFRWVHFVIESIMLCLAVEQTSGFLFLLDSCRILLVRTIIITRHKQANHLIDYAT